MASYLHNIFEAFSFMWTQFEMNTLVTSNTILGFENIKANKIFMKTRLDLFCLNQQRPDQLIQYFRGEKKNFLESSSQCILTTYSLLIIQGKETISDAAQTTRISFGTADFVILASAFIAAAASLSYDTSTTEPTFAKSSDAGK